MRHIDHSPDQTYKIAIAIKDAALNEQQIRDYYLNQIDTDKIVSFSLDYGGKKKPTAKTRKDYLSVLLPALVNLNIDYLVCADGEYFKTLCKQTKSEPHYGYVLPCALPGFEHINVVLVPNYQSLFFKPEQQNKIDLSLAALNSHLDGTYRELGKDIIKYEYYPQTLSEIESALESLHQYPAITSDIEGFSLKHYEAGIGTIGFAWNEHEGFSFPIDFKEWDEPQLIEVWDTKDKKYKKKIAYGCQYFNAEVRALLKKFFTDYKGKIIWHNAGYDVYVLIYQLWMDGFLDQEGMLEGLEIMCRTMEDSKLVTYLATNSCTGNHLSLKDQAHEFAGNYAESEINNIRLIPKDKLLKYNLVDCMSTWFVMDKHYDTMVLDEQLDLYEDFKGYLKDIIQMQLTGMCLDMPRVKEVHTELTKIRDTSFETILNEPLTQEFILEERKAFLIKRNSELKTKQLVLEDVNVDFKPNSPAQMSRFLYEYLGLPVIETSKQTKAPSTGGKVIKKLLNHTEDERVKIILQGLVDFASAEKIISTFISKFLEAPLTESGNHYVFGAFNLGGTVSGRLSASGGLNLQTIPSGSRFAKLIKSCFKADDGWLFGGADFASLEDRISALTTEDPEKLAVYTQGYDGHSYRAVRYWPHEFPNVDPNDPNQVNVISQTEKGDKLRSKGKAPTFLLTYGGTYAGLMTNCGFSKDEALALEKSYHELYVVSDQWVKEHIERASKTGYVECAFGLRVRTPVLTKTIMDSRLMTKEAAAEARTAGNALGQSWCLLNNRAANEFMERVRNSKYKYDIRICAQIHDAVYLYFRDNWETVHWVNQNLGECMSWQEDPLIQHDTVKLFGELDVFYPNWGKPITLKNNISLQEIKETIINEANIRKEKSRS